MPPENSIGKPPIILEILHEGEHWVPCIYMASLVKEATQEFGAAVLVKTVITKKIEGAKRYQEIIKQEKYLIPIPSIMINNQLIFRTIPEKEELVNFLNNLIHT